MSLDIRPNLYPFVPTENGLTGYTKEVMEKTFELQHADPESVDSIDYLLAGVIDDLQHEGRSADEMSQRQVYLYGISKGARGFNDPDQTPYGLLVARNLQRPVYEGAALTRVEVGVWLDAAQKEARKRRGFKQLGSNAVLRFLEMASDGDDHGITSPILSVDTQVTFAANRQNAIAPRLARNLAEEFGERAVPVGFILGSHKVRGLKNVPDVDKEIMIDALSQSYVGGI